MKKFELKDILLVLVLIALVIGYANFNEIKSFADKVKDQTFLSEKVISLEKDVKSLKDEKLICENPKQHQKPLISEVSKKKAHTSSAGTGKSKTPQKEEFLVESHAKSGGFTPALTNLEEGKVYSDGNGNTYERHQAGTRECKFYINGELVKRQFVQNPDPRESKKQCDLLANEFQASLTPTTSEKSLSYNAPAGNASSSNFGKGETKCELKFNGNVVETTTTQDDSSCKAWTLAKAKEKGWVAR